MRHRPATDRAENQAAIRRDGFGSNNEDGADAFGSTAHFTSTAGSNNIPLEFTVAAPYPFTPSKDASVFDATVEYSSPQEGSLQDTNVYFAVTITNTSDLATGDHAHEE